MTSKLSKPFIYFLPPLFLFAAGIALLFAPYSPGDLSNIIAWLETDGNYLSLVAGSALIILAITALVFTLRPINSSLHIVHGKLTCIIEQNVMKKVIEQILSEYCEDSSLQAEVALNRGILHILVEVPPEFTDLEALAEHLRDKLYLLTGYYGEIRLSKRVKALSGV